MADEQTNDTSSGQPAASTKGKGKAFFDRADEVAETGNWDFAIEMYLEGIQREPGAIERGHQKLREVALRRKAQGGKGPGMMEGFKRGTSKDPVQNLLNAEYLLAKDPGNVQYMVRVLDAAQKIEDRDVILWIGDILLEAQRLAKRKNKRVLLQLTDAFDKAREYQKALAAAMLARETSPNDQAIEATIRELGVKDLEKKAKYGQEGTSFTEGVKDMEKQRELMESDSMTKSASFLEKQLVKARAGYEEKPNEPGKIHGLADALVRFEDEAYENEAIDILRKAHADTGSYQFKSRADDIKMRQMRRQYNQLHQTGDKQAMLEMAKKILAFELGTYAERAKNYPTDLGIKYELGLRQFKAGQLDDAIGSLQQAQRDPRRNLAAMNYLGQAFTKKKWYRQAADTYQKVLQADIPDDRAKEIRYNLAQVLEEMGEAQKALDEYSRVVQIDYNYKDARQRLDALNEQLSSQG